LALLAALGCDSAEAAGARSKRLTAGDGPLNLMAVSKRLKAKGGDSLAAEADESVAEQVNDPTSFLREVRLDAAVEHGTGSSHTTVDRWRWATQSTFGATPKSATQQPCRWDICSERRSAPSAPR
jgi:hypothetical protein